MSRKLHTLSVKELGAGFAAGSFSPVDVLESTLDAAARVNPHINAFCHIDTDGALQQAEAAARRWERGAQLRPLDGIPVSVKDLILTRGMPTLRGSRTTNPDQPWDEDAPAVARLRAAGAVLYAKTTTTEFGGSAFSRSPLTGATRNPWNLEYGCSGSSMGAAAHLAAGIGPLALGNDASGSIRMPASVTGIFGLKPSFGIVANHPPASAGILGHTGPLSRTVADAAAMLAVIAGPDPRDAHALPAIDLDLSSIEAGVEGLRIAYSPTLGLQEPDKDVRRATDSAVERLRSLGATVEQVAPHLPGLLDAYNILRICNRAASYRAAGGDPAKMDPVVARVLRQADRFTTSDYIKAEKTRAELQVRMQLFHRSWDLLITPTLAIPPYPVDTDNGPEDEHWYMLNGHFWSPYTFPFNMTHQPAATLPCGLSDKNGRAAEELPIGLQIVAAPWRDDLVLRVASALEADQPFPLSPIAREETGI
ncbi:amidase [Nitratireductor sp. GISD-1A_MAKvit]|uniref:amidase n=1 Tax=Nitratireductor sp. GISD-1A_MAKvit TaxID=3234198 RepID=UPI0034653E26